MIVYILLAGGLGNQFFQYSAAASMNPLKIVFVDLIANARVGADGKPDIFNFQLPISIEYKKYKVNCQATKQLKIIFLLDIFSLIYMLRNSCLTKNL